VPKWRDAALLGLIAVLLLGATVTRPNLVLVTGRGLLFPNGTAAAPSIATVNDPTTGWYSPSAGTWEWVYGAGVGSGIKVFRFLPYSFILHNAGQIEWTATDSSGTADTILVRGAPGLVGFGGATSSFPGLKRAGTVLETKFADDSGYAQHKADNFVATNTTTSGFSCVSAGDCDIGSNGAPIGGIWLNDPQITAGSGTGVTVNDSGSVRTLVYKVTVLSTNCIAASTTCDLTIATLPASTHLQAVYAQLVTAYACATTCTTSTLSGALGTTAGGTELLATMDLDVASDVLFGNSDAELGTSMNAAARVARGNWFFGVDFSWSTTTTVTYRITSGTGNLGTGAATNLSQGTIVFYLVTAVMP